ncbi:hypothetical protein LCGC14_3115720 [marine sediment metagenome]|uniref:N-acylglucosamine 2-epimerase n=1 Tax=marine sediment metagenome TaxID=412755 RepID=A0A0F8YTR9_9ZZZZ
MQLFYDGLVNDTLPFWLKHSVDTKYGGYNTVLDRKGEILGPDKSTWVQGRFIWVLSKLYNELEKTEEWLETARHGVDFL